MARALFNQGISTADEPSFPNVTAAFNDRVTTVDMSAGNYTLADSDALVEITAISGLRDFNLSVSSAGYGIGRKAIVLNTSGNTQAGVNQVTIKPNGPQTIDGVLAFPLTVPYSTVVLEAVAGGWITRSNTAYFNSTDQKAALQSVVTQNASKLLVVSGSAAVSEASDGRNFIGVDTTALVVLTLSTADISAGLGGVIKDVAGNAVNNPISVVTEGAQLIDGKASYTIGTNYGHLNFKCFNGAVYVWGSPDTQTLSGFNDGAANPVIWKDANPTTFTVIFETTAGNNQLKISASSGLKVIYSGYAVPSAIESVAQGTPTMGVGTAVYFGGPVFITPSPVLTLASGADMQFLNISVKPTVKTIVYSARIWVKNLTGIKAGGFEWGVQPSESIVT